VLPRRWVIERSFAWLGRNRRLAKDFERLIEVSTAMVVVAIIQLLIRRLATLDLQAKVFGRALIGIVVRCNSAD
jgi:putative transposase